MSKERCSMTRRLEAALICFIAVAGVALGCVAASAQLMAADGQGLPFERLAVPTTLAWSAIPPSIDPVVGTDGRIHLAYEMLFTNTTGGTVSVDSVEVVDPARDNKVVGRNQVFTLLDEDVTAQLRPFARPFTCLCARDYSHELGPGESGAMYFDVTFTDFKSVPREIAHRVSATKAAVIDETPSPPTEEPPIVEEPASNQIVAIGGAVKVKAKPAITLSPPLRGDGWVDGNGCCAIIGPHRFTIITGSGSLYVPQRFAIDYLQIDAQGRAWVGTKSNLTDWKGFGAEIRAAAAGRVVSAVDGYDDNIPGEVPPITAANIAGNHVIIDMGDGTFALYAHLRKGTVMPRRGDFVSRGQLLGYLGNSGNSDGPHLHFEIMAAPSSLEANGLPFVFDKMKYQGAVKGTLQDLFDKLLSGGSVEVDSAGSGIRTGQMPLTFDVMSYR